jgi:hypothetical protein
MPPLPLSCASEGSMLVTSMSSSSRGGQMLLFYKRPQPEGVWSSPITLATL